MWYQPILTPGSLWKLLYVEDWEDGCYYLMVKEIQPKDFIKGCPAGVKTLMQLKEEFSEQPKCLGVAVFGTEIFINFADVKQEHQRGDVLPGMVMRLAGGGR